MNKAYLIKSNYEEMINKSVKRLKELHGDHLKPVLCGNEALLMNGVNLTDGAIEAIGEGLTNTMMFVNQPTFAFEESFRVHHDIHDIKFMVRVVSCPEVFQKLKYREMGGFAVQTLESARDEINDIIDQCKSEGVELANVTMKFYIERLRKITLRLAVAATSNIHNIKNTDVAQLYRDIPPFQSIDAHQLAIEQLLKASRMKALQALDESSQSTLFQTHPSQSTSIELKDLLSFKKRMIDSGPSARDFEAKLPPELDWNGGEYLDELSISPPVINFGPLADYKFKIRPEIRPIDITLNISDPTINAADKDAHPAISSAVLSSTIQHSLSGNTELPLLKSLSADDDDIDWSKE